MFEQEASLIPWVVSRAAIPALYYQTVEGKLGTPFIPVVERAMGVGHIGDLAAGDDEIGVSPDWNEKLSDSQKEMVIGVYCSVSKRVFDYERIADVAMSELDPIMKFPANVGLDLIAWTAVATLRIECAENLLAKAQPDELELPGWYVEPVFQKAERYWDGTDWTSHCRVLRGRRYESVELALN